MQSFVARRQKYTWSNADVIINAIIGARASIYFPFKNENALEKFRVYMASIVYSP